MARKKNKAFVSIEAVRPSDLLCCPEYETAYIQMRRQILDGFHNLDPILKRLPPIETDHCGPAVYTQAQQAPLQQEMATFRFGVSAEIDPRTPDIEAHTVFLYDFANAYIGEMVPTTLERISDVAEAHGNHLNADGRPPSWDLWMDVLEKIEIDFDEDDRPMLPTLFVNSRTSEDFKKALSQPLVPAQRRRLKEISTQKKADFDARYPSRRLSL